MIIMIIIIIFKQSFVNLPLFPHIKTWETVFHVLRSLTYNHRTEVIIQ